MNKIITLLLSGVCMFATSCKIDVEYAYTTTLTLKNQSSHSITIKGSDNEYILDCTIHPGESYSCQDNFGESPWYPVLFTGIRCFVCFDDNIKIVHGLTFDDIPIEHNICDENSYTVEVSGRHKTKFVYTYTFTDEDYDRAVAANAKKQ